MNTFVKVLLVLAGVILIIKLWPVILAVLALLGLGALVSGGVLAGGASAVLGVLGAIGTVLLIVTTVAVVALLPVLLPVLVGFGIYTWVKRSRAPTVPRLNP